MKKHNTSSQAGFVSLFSVIFFTLLAIVITVGFIRLMTTEQQQALNNDLTARALAAAEGGVEDAKRAISYYASRPAGADKERIRDSLNSDNCDSLFSSTSDVGAAIGIAGNEGLLATGQNLRYTCLIVNLDTADYIQTLAAGTSQVIPLKGEDSFDHVTLEWHLTSDQADGKSGDGIPRNYRSGGELPTVAEFGATGSQPPAYMRVQLFGKPAGSFSRVELEARSHTVFLLPRTAGGGNSIAFTAADIRGFNVSKSSPIDTSCRSSDDAAANIGKYACNFTFALPAGGGDYYLQITPIYRDTRIRLQLKQGGDVVKFNEVQPQIDSTGVAADVYRRVEARTDFPGNTFTGLRYGAEVGENICKNFYVTNDPAQWQDNQCNTPAP